MRPFPHSLVLAAGLAIALAGTAAPAAAQPSCSAPVAGGSSSGDPYFPGLGNTGYDALSYDLALRYRLETQALRGTAVIRIRTTRALSSFNLDLRDLTVSQ
jgi:hypothetical protein